MLKIFALCVSVLASSTSVFAAEVRFQDRGLGVTVALAEPADAAALYAALDLHEESADEGTLKALDAAEPTGESLRLFCNADHNDYCQLTYRAAVAPRVEGARAK